jgi:hypothetical protein
VAAPPTSLGTPRGAAARRSAPCGRVRGGGRRRRAAQLAYEEAADLAVAALDVLRGRAGDGSRDELLVTLGDA